MRTVQQQQQQQSTTAASNTLPPIPSTPTTHSNLTGGTFHLQPPPAPRKNRQPYSNSSSGSIFPPPQNTLSNPMGGAYNNPALPPHWQSLRQLIGAQQNPQPQQATGATAAAMATAGLQGNSPSAATNLAVAAGKDWFCFNALSAYFQCPTKLFAW